jgi:hypothetical protein
MLEQRKKREEAEDRTDGSRLLVVRQCLLAHRNYRRNPGAYHYLAGGIANLIYLEPSPRTYRSDCSQFAASVQHGGKAPDIGPNGPMWVNTWIMDDYLQVTDRPNAADFGMYGPRGNPHHVEVYLGSAGAKLAPSVGLPAGDYEFVGHGSPPIDTATPGRPDYYLKNPLGGR